MTKQEEIREGIERTLKFFDDIKVRNRAAESEAVIEYLHTKGVVIKVERELPFPMITIRTNDPRYQDGAMQQGMKLMLKAGWEAVEPIRKEG